MHCSYLCFDVQDQINILFLYEPFLLKPLKVITENGYFEELFPRKLCFIARLRTQWWLSSELSLKDWMYKYIALKSVLHKH